MPRKVDKRKPEPKSHTCNWRTDWERLAKIVDEQRAVIFELQNVDRVEAIEWKRRFDALLSAIPDLRTKDNCCFGPCSNSIEKG